MTLFRPITSDYRKKIIVGNLDSSLCGHIRWCGNFNQMSKSWTRVGLSFHYYKNIVKWRYQWHSNSCWFWWKNRIYLDLIFNYNDLDHVEVKIFIDTQLENRFHTNYFFTQYIYIYYIDVLQVDLRAMKCKWKWTLGFVYII